eukprot:6329667-Pyramimonas_sp.AAC.1
MNCFGFLSPPAPVTPWNRRNTTKTRRAPHGHRALKGTGPSMTTGDFDSPQLFRGHREESAEDEKAV